MSNSSEACPSSNRKSIGATVLIEALLAEGVDGIWGYPGGSVLYIYDELYKQTDLKHYLVRHEQAAVHAADGYARSTGKVGVCLVTSGPGVTNAVTGLATAYMDSIPLVIISGQVPSYAIGQDAFQECDAIGITRPCVKHNFLVKDVRTLAATVKKAFHIAKTGRPGPVLIDIPKDVSAAPATYSPIDRSVTTMRSYNPVVHGHAGQIRKALLALAKARRPYIYAGGGVILSNASNELRRLSNALGLPVTLTLMGLGAVQASDEKFLGMLGMHGTYEANMAMQYCDVLLAVGARFDDRVIGDPNHFIKEPKTIIHIDIDPSSISKRVKVDIPIVGDVKAVLSTMLDLLGEQGSEPRVVNEEKIRLRSVGRSSKTAIDGKEKFSWPGIDKESLDNWWREIKKWRAIDSLKFDEANGLIKPQRVLSTLAKLTKGKAFVCSDVGQHQMWTAQYYPFERPRQWINSGGLGTMGFGLPAAMGVKMAHPDSDVVCITGEGSIQMCIQELSTCKQFNLPIKIISLNNRYLGMVRQWQELDYEERYANSYMNGLPDFVRLAEAYGHVGLLVERPEDVEPALKEALSLKDRTVFLDIRTDPGENVWPMVKAGRGISEMLLSPACRRMQKD